MLELELDSEFPGEESDPSEKAVEEQASGSQAPPESAVDRTKLLARIDRLLELGRGKAAEKDLRQLLVQDPEDYEVLFRLANLSASQGDYGAGIELLSAVPPDDPRAGLAALGTAADWCIEAKRFDEAIGYYEQILRLNASVNLARRKLAYLFNRLGRRHEAVKRIRELCLLSDIMQDELHGLVVEGDAMYDAPGTQPAAGVRPYWPIGASGEARHLGTLKQYREAAELIEASVLSGEASPAVTAFYGRMVVESQQPDKLAAWAALVDEDVRQFPDFWAALGSHFVLEADYDKAIPALAQALRLDATDLPVIRRLYQSLQSSGRSDEAQLWIDRYTVMTDIIEANNRIAGTPNGQIDPTLYQKLADNLKQVGREAESVYWRLVAASKTGDRSAVEALQTEVKTIIADRKAFPKQDQLWCGMTFDVDLEMKLPPQWRERPKTADEPSTRSVIAPTAEIARAVFREVTQEVGLDHAYKIATDPPSKRFPIYQVYGGGVAVMDFDLDSHPDLYFAQGAADPPDFVAVASDLLYRHLPSRQGARLRDVTNVAGVTDDAFTVGVTSGDWNQDGWPDLAVSNIGVHRLLLNRGDGTFDVQDLEPEKDLIRLGTSLAIGDLTGDHLPDLFVAHFLRDPNLTRLPPVDQTGEITEVIAPIKSIPHRDRLFVNQADGSWRSELVGTDESDACTGLGLVVGDLDPDSVGNEVYVANDVRKNQFWKQNADGERVDAAAVMGCAYGSLGFSTGAMGIVAEDFDRSGTLDLHVTNYVEEPDSLYLKENGIYRDLNERFRIAAATRAMVGFGTQTIDYSNDGWPDYVVTNGHVDDLTRLGQPFRQPLQLFANRGIHFQVVDVEDATLWNQPRVGRALARLDFNDDGKMDFVITDLLAPSALILNESPTDNHWVKLRLVGTKSERDAIGARVEVKTEKQSWLLMVQAGDGYLAKNETVLHLGLGEESVVKSITVHWPAGQWQEYSDIQVDSTSLLVEGDS
ncbi:MAG: FG-GAP-like repeat-containing protein, partial [Planctomycetota bacterium]